MFTVIGTISSFFRVDIQSELTHSEMSRPILLYIICHLKACDASRLFEQLEDDVL